MKKSQAGGVASNQGAQCPDYAELWTISVELEHKSSKEWTLLLPGELKGWRNPIVRKNWYNELEGLTFKHLLN